MTEEVRQEDRMRELVEWARNHKMTAAEKFEQRVSFVYGQQDHDKPMRSKDEIRAQLAESQGYPIAELAALRTRIAELEGENRGLREALEPFARVARINAPIAADWPDDLGNSHFIPSAWPTWGDFKRADDSLAQDAIALNGELNDG